MAIDPKVLEERVVEQNNSGWTADQTLNMSENELDRLIESFGLVAADVGIQLKPRLERLFRMFVVQASIERPALDTPSAADVGNRNTQNKTAKASTIALRELRELEAGLEAFEGSLVGLSAYSKSALNVAFEEMGTKSASGAMYSIGRLKEDLLPFVDQLFGALREIDVQPVRGPSNVAIHNLVEALVVVWADVHGVLPTTDKGRGNRDDPFLALCQNFVQIAEPKIKELGGALGTRNLSGIVSQIVQKNRATEK